MSDRVEKGAVIFGVGGLAFGLFCVGLAGPALYSNQQGAKALAVETKALQLQTERVMFLEDLLLKIFPEVPSTVYSTPVTVTAYSARVEECDSTPWHTADMTLSRVGLLAVSDDIFDELGLSFGDVVILEGLGVFRVRDRMNPRWHRRVDILMANKEAATLFGKREGVALTWMGKG